MRNYKQIDVEKEEGRIRKRDILAVIVAFLGVFTLIVAFI